MAKICLALILFITTLNAYSQQDGLILIDAEDNRPFYLKMGDKIYNSSPIGHLTVSNLKDSTYIITIGFPNNHFPESQFSVRVIRKDQGFHLRQSEDKGPELYNWQTRETILRIPSLANARTRNLTKGIRMDDDFSRLMAAVVNDTLVMYNTYIPDRAVDSLKSISEAKVQAPKKLETVGDSTKKQVAANIPVPAGDKPVKKKPGKLTKMLPVIMIGQQTLADAYQVTYVSYTKKGRADTVRIEIPFETTEISGRAEPNAMPDKAVANNQEFMKDSGVIVPAVPETKKKATNSNCKKTATDHEIDALRVKMMNEDKEDHRVDVAKKFFTTKCVSVNQVKALSELFSGDKSRYQFYEAAYPFVSDPENFGELSASLLDKSYKDQFNAQF